METEELSAISFDLFIDDADEKEEPGRKEKVGDTARFTPNYRDSEWFIKSPPTDDLQAAQMAKFTADLLYYKGNYEEALSEYERCVSLVSKTNNTLRRDVKESIGWTILKLNDSEKASSQLDPGSESSDNTTSFYFLTSEILSRDHESWQRLASLHPHNDFCWMKLARSFQLSSLPAQAAIAFGYATTLARRHISSSTSFSGSRHRAIECEGEKELAKLIACECDRRRLIQEVHSITDEVVEYKDVSKFVGKYFPLSLQNMVGKMT